MYNRKGMEIILSKKNKDKYKEHKLEPMLIDVDRYLTSPDECECECEESNFVYKGLGLYVCQGCGMIFKNEYGRVRDCVDEYGTTLSTFEIAEKTNVSRHIIELFIKDGRFVEVEKQRVCRVCKQPIDAGMYCNKCALRQIEDSFEEKVHRKFSSGVRMSGDMTGEMHTKKQVESFSYEGLEESRANKNKKKK